jgi:hypothetical protein
MVWSVNGMERQWYGALEVWSVNAVSIRPQAKISNNAG